MGKVRGFARGKKESGFSADSTSPPPKINKSVGKKLIAKQSVKFKSKSVRQGEAGSHGLSEKGTKLRLQKDLVARAVVKQPNEVKRSPSLERQVRVNVKASSIIIPKSSTISKLSNKRAKKKKAKGESNDAGDSSSEPYLLQARQLPKKSDDIPLGVEMPKTIETPGISLTDWNFKVPASLDSDITLNMDTSDIIDKNALESPVTVKGSTSSQVEMDYTEIPLAVVMPSDLSNSPGYIKAKKDVSKLKMGVSQLCKGQPEKKKSWSGKLSENQDNVDKQSKETGMNNTIGETDQDESNRTKKQKARRDHDVQVLDSIKVHVINNMVVLQFSHPKEFYIFGQVEVQVLHGKIRILGYELDNTSGSNLVSSLRGSSFLSIQTVVSSNSTGVDLPQGLQDENAIRSLISDNSDSTWVLLKEGNREFLEYIQKYLEFPIAVQELKKDDSSLLSEAQETLSCVFQPVGKRLNEAVSWDCIPQAMIKEKKGCTVLCGGKGVGKSTLLRYLVNRILSRKTGRSRGVVVLDFDPGQAEFTVPGCVSVSLIKEPLLGPNYTHLQSTERCVYIGDVSVAQCAGRYMEAAVAIIKFYKESPHLSDFPCIVNTMGFTKGIGVTLMGQLLTLIQPNRVVQIDSRRERENYPFQLTRSEVLSFLDSSNSRCISEGLKLVSPEKGLREYDFIPLKSAAEARLSKDENVWGMKPRIAREAVILSYFSSLACPPSFSILDDVPFSCPLGTLFLCVAHERVPPNNVLAAINGNMVALCCINPETENALYHQDREMPPILTKVPIAPCLGFGIIRGVDMASKMLYLSTPLEQDKLFTVNCLIFGAVNLPHSVYVKTPAPGLVPYVSCGPHADVFVSEKITDNKN